MCVWKESFRQCLVDGGSLTSVGPHPGGDVEPLWPHGLDSLLPVLLPASPHLARLLWGRRAHGAGASPLPPAVRPAGEQRRLLPVHTVGFLGWELGQWVLQHPEMRGGRLGEKRSGRLGQTSLSPVRGSCFNRVFAVLGLCSFFRSASCGLIDAALRRLPGRDRRWCTPGIYSDSLSLNLYSAFSFPRK